MKRVGRRRQCRDNPSLRRVHHWQFGSWRADGQPAKQICCCRSQLEPASEPGLGLRIFRRADAELAAAIKCRACNRKKLTAANLTELEVLFCAAAESGSYLNSRSLRRQHFRHPVNQILTDFECRANLIRGRGKFSRQAGDEQTRLRAAPTEQFCPIDCHQLRGHGQVRRLEPLFGEFNDFRSIKLRNSLTTPIDSYFTVQ